jgi:ABC-type transport system substrate-binding protein
VERRFDSPDSALRALQRGEVLLVDRIRPADAARLAQRSDVKVLRYALPTVHLLLFHPHRPLGSRALFRRALAHATSREAALRELASGAPDGSMALLRNAFPLDAPGAEHDPVLAAALFAACRQGSERTTLVLAHPPTPEARQACAILANQWALAGHGLDVQLLEWTAQAAAAPPEFDVLYVEWPAMDPLADGVRLCSLEPVAQPGGPLLERAAAALAQAADTAAARRALASVIRALHVRTLVIPLWQTTEFMAVHRSLSGLPEVPATTYDGVENWTISP